MKPTPTDQPSPAVADGSVRSADGTRIAFRRLGNGPAVVFVHGSLSTHTDWMRVAKLLAGSFTCFLMDRRGRAKSGEGIGPYSMDREVEDIAAVLSAAESDAAREPALAAHSFGAACALEAALRHPVSRLVLYEPPLPAGGLASAEHVAQYAHAVSEGDMDKAVELGLTHFSHLSPEAIALARTSPGWQRLCALAKSWIRELGAIGALSSDVEPYRSLACPSMLLIGSLSPRLPMQQASRALAQVLPNVRVEWLPGQGHTATRTAPAMVASLIREFLLTT
jgi:pimeloyl-ACP methyl ester carboxylesterase